MLEASSPDRLAGLQVEIGKRIHEFDVPALLDLLAALGYGPANLEFRGHLASGPQPTLLHAIEFPARDQPTAGAAKVVITVNLGLLSCRSPLPSYFQRFLADLDTRDPVLELLAVLDRSLLHERLTCDRPDRMLVTWTDTQRNFLRIFGLDSPVGLRWLFRQVFPELGVRVRRVRDDYRVPYQGATIGESKLGECSFGSLTRVGVYDMEVTLICEDAIYQRTTHGTTPWIREGDRRLRAVVFPLLDEICMTLTVAFVLLDGGEGARVGPTSYAGYNPMWRSSEPPVIQLPPSRVEVYRGALPRLEPDTERLEQLLGDDPATLQVEPQRGEAVEQAPLGRTVDLMLTCREPGRRPHRYLARVHWGARAWYREEPFRIVLSCEGVPKRLPTLREHPRAWSTLRDAAREWIADRLTHEVLATVESEWVDEELIERLIDARAFDHLHALAVSKIVRQELWDDAAWRRFANWSAA